MVHPHRGLFLIALFKSLLQGALDLKSFRDVLIIPTFIMLGMCIDEEEGIKAIILLNAIVMFFLLIEIFATDIFAAIFKVKEYYISTRGFKDENFFNKDSDLFLERTRPGERFISFLDIHRASSVFLEPPSLGNYCLILTIFIIVYWERFKIYNKVTLVFSNVLILIASIREWQVRLLFFCCSSLPSAGYSLPTDRSSMSPE